MKRLFNRKFKLLRNLTLSGIALLLSTAPAHALPGQNLETIREWSKKSFVLPPALVYNPDYDAYTGIRTIKDGMLALSVKVDPQDKTSVHEQVVTLLNRPGFAFTRSNLQGLKLVEQIYNPQIAEDFRTSKFVAQVGEVDFYQGDQFVYTTHNRFLRGIRRFDVIPVDNLKQAIDREVFCQTNKCNVYQPLTPIAPIQ